MKIGDIEIEIQRKNIKNMHLYVKPPLGNVLVTVPESVNDKVIEIFVRTNMPKIRTEQKKIQEQLRLSPRQYVTGEEFYWWGKKYYFVFRPDPRRNSLIFEGNKAVLGMRAESTVKQRENYIKEQYRASLKEQLSLLVPKWEDITGLKSNSWEVVYMTTCWGTCGIKTKKLRFNLQLAEKPVLCLEYIILHELAHIAEKNHNDHFISILDSHMPNWRSVRDTLNKQILDWM